MWMFIRILICLFEVLHYIIGITDSHKKELCYINIQEIFLINKDNYYVIFFLPDCMSCLTLNEYLENSFSHLDLFYLIDISDYEYTNNLMQKNNVGVSCYTDIQINSAPTLLLIKSKIIIYQVEGLESIHSYLEEQF